MSPRWFLHLSSSCNLVTSIRPWTHCCGLRAGNHRICKPRSAIREAPFQPEQRHLAATVTDRCSEIGIPRMSARPAPRMNLTLSARSCAQSAEDVILTPSITISPRSWRELYPTEIDGRPTRTYFHWLALVRSDVARTSRSVAAGRPRQAWHAVRLADRRAAWRRSVRVIGRSRTGSDARRRHTHRVPGPPISRG
jgi:hypothetical protein